MPSVHSASRVLTLNKKHTIGYISLNLKHSPSELSIEEA